MKKQRNFPGIRKRFDRASETSEKLKGDRNITRHLDLVKFHLELGYVLLCLEKSISTIVELPGLKTSEHPSAILFLLFMIHT